MPTRQPQPAADAAIVAAYQLQTDALRNQVNAWLTSIWQSLGTYRTEQRTSFLRQFLPVIAAAQRQMSSLTVGFHTAQRNAILGRTLSIHVDPATVTGAAARNGTPPETVYSRPFSLVWRQLADLPHEEGAIEQAIEAGYNRAVETALTDLQLTKVQTSAKVAANDPAIKWTQRVLEGPHSCGLCIVASTQRYHRDTLLPIHPGCDCSQRFVYGETDPGQIVDPETLVDVHDRIAQRFGSDNSGARQIPTAPNGKGGLLQYRDVLITHDHGELGPVLGVRGQPFLGPADI